MLAILFLFVALALSYPTRGPCTGDCWTHDPAMLQRHSDGKYFRFATANGVNIMTSDSIRGPWKDVGAALPNGSNIKMDGVNSLEIWVRELLNASYDQLALILRTGPRCTLRGRHLLHVLRDLDVRHPELGNRRGFVQGHGTRFVDRSRPNRHPRKQRIQQDRPQLDLHRRQAVPAIRIFLERYSPD